ncbi:MAG: hypothetical protein IJP57_08505, partial [Firmicutes bacterium]|nr:hypothetical protein [Bacillota bacterium]
VLRRRKADRARRAVHGSFRAFLQLQKSAERAMDCPPRTVRFAPAQDTSARVGQLDLYGQLGCEVSALAQQLAAR